VDRTHRQHPQRADVQVGDHQGERLAEQGDLAADRDDGDRQEPATTPISGAIVKIGCLTMPGVMSSLKNILMPSTSVWRTPNGPTRLGPSRDCIRATIRRSAQISSAVASRK
jgi:hypothetical protein